jgi:hypothetical protein
VAKLAAHRAGLDQQARMNIANILGPLVRTGQQQYGSAMGELAGLAGNIMSSGQYYRPQGTGLEGMGLGDVDLNAFGGGGGMGVW